MPSLEGLSAGAAQLLALLPVGYAFLAGMLATMNPCGLAMLPAYVGYYLGLETGGTGAEGPARVSAVSRGLQGLELGGSVTAGFVVLFLVAGLLVQEVSRSLSAVFGGGAGSNGTVLAKGRRFHLLRSEVVQVPGRARLLPLRGGLRPGISDLHPAHLPGSGGYLFRYIGYRPGAIPDGELWPGYGSGGDYGYP